MTIDGPTVVVVGAGFEGKRRYYERLARLGARLVIVEEPGHWSQSLADEIAGHLGRHTRSAATRMWMPRRSSTPWSVRAFAPTVS